MKKYLFLFTVLTIFPVQAQNIEIDADERIEWYRDEQKIIAIGDTVARKGDNTLKGNVLTVFYERVQLEDGTKKQQIQKLLSEGNVKIEMQNAKGRGEHFTYDLPTKEATLKGKPAEIENKLGTITATQGVTYYGQENKSVALGDVVAQNPDYTIYANKMISYFNKDNKGNQTLNRVEIYADNAPIKIVNAQATVTGRKGTYFPSENKIKIFDNVTITQNENILNGDYAETDLNTGISRLLSTKSKGRVSGIFHNKSKK